MHGNMNMDKELLEINITDLGLYKKKKIKQHFVKSTDVGQKGDVIDILTKEGVIELLVDENTYIMIGNFEDIYPIAKNIFDFRYRIVEIGDINQTVRDFINHYSISKEKIKGCQLREDVFVYAKEIDSSFCVYEKYTHSILKGNPGDYYAISREDLSNTYIIQKDIMEKSYDPIL